MGFGRVGISFVRERVTARCEYLFARPHDTRGMDRLRESLLNAPVVDEAQG
jgi:hypothetical protein